VPVSASGDSQEAEDRVGRVVDSRLFARLLGFLAPHWRESTLALFLLVVSSLLQLVGPLVTAVALDRFVGTPVESDSRFSRWVAGWTAGVDPQTGLLACCAVFLAAVGLTFVVLWAQGFVLQMMGQRIMATLRERLFGHLQRVPMVTFDRTPVGRLVTRVTTDVDALNELFTAGIVSVFGDLLLLVGIAVALFVLDWRLALAAFAILPLLAALTTWFKARAHASYREVRAKVARLNAFFQEHVTGMTVVQLFGREERQLAEFREINRQHRDANVRGIVAYALFYPGVELITAFGVALILTFGGGRVLAGGLTVGALVAFLQYAQRFYQPLSDLSEKFNVLQQAMASAERIFMVLDEPLTIVSPPAAHRPDRIAGEIVFDRVGFSYGKGAAVLTDVSFRVAPGEMVAIVGHTGAGKSTLANLLLRLYDVESGAVRFDGVDVREWDLDRLRGSIGLVLQDVFLFAGTLRENIRRGDPTISDARVERAAADVGLLALKSLDESIRERGAGLSVGEKQLVSFARALAFDPRVLVLDEATSAVDPETEARIQGALETVLRGRSSIVIAHRLVTVERADRLIVLHRGEVVESGTHRELLRAGGFYSKLHRLQFAAESAA
jgi:ATP-binding cassette, subfamily B, multidrug efflux pump